VHVFLAVQKSFLALKYVSTRHCFITINICLNWTDLEEVEWQDVEWIHLAQAKDKC
jgi:hypothetical protein